MIAALISGKLLADPEKRTASNGKSFTLARVAAAAEDGDCLCSVIAFGSVAEQLAALAKGDTVSITGRAKVTSWTGKDGEHKTGLSVTADALLTVYHQRRKRAAMAGEPEESGR